MHIFQDTRYKLLLLRPGQKVSWTGYALTHHLLKNYDTALRILNEFRKCQPFDYEYSELLLYEVMIMLECNKEKDALELVEKYKDQIVDKTSLLEMKGLLLYFRIFFQLKFY